MREERRVESEVTRSVQDLSQSRGTHAKKQQFHRITTKNTYFHNPGPSTNEFLQFISPSLSIQHYYGMYSLPNYNFRFLKCEIEVLYC